MAAVFIKLDLVTVSVDFEVKLVIAAIFSLWLRLEEVFIVAFSQKLFITRGGQILVESELWLCRWTIA